jgi:hypothetical protein
LHLFVIAPCYGEMDYSVSEAIRYGTAGRFRDYSYTVASFSLTQHAFNIGLATALDARDAMGVTHIGMIHSDILPEGPWADILLGQMEAAELDVLSAVVPIKNDEGKTSTAIGDRLDPWAVKRYVTLADEKRTCATFTTVDVAWDEDEFLLVNTGLWLARADLPFWDGFAFEVKSRVIHDEHGKRAAQCRPEDWEWSRAMDEAGVKYGATWAVRLGHKGTKVYRNR